MTISRIGAFDGTSKKSSSINVGDRLKLAMSNGEKIHLKVRQIDSAKIFGIQTVVRGYKVVHANKTLMIRDIRQIRKRKFNPVKTFFVLGGLGVVTYFLIAKPPIDAQGGSWDCCTALNSLQLNLDNP